MKKLMTAALFGTLTIGAGTLWADDDDYYERGSSRRAPDVAPVSNELYRSECAACHFAYQPGLLPARSWRYIMGNLADHYGDNAELDPDTVASLLTYLEANAADNAAERRSRRIVGSLAPDEVPLRITELPHLRHEHNEIPRRYLRDERIGSLSNCSACHTRAEEGSYREREISIPGLGRWDD